GQRLAEVAFGDECTEDLDCPEGDYCVDGRCELDDREGCSVCEVCTSHAACGVGGYCAGLGRNSDSGICTKYCTSSAQCPGNSECVLWDSGRGEVQVCGSAARDDDGALCAEGWQCTVACRDDVPCGAGEVCAAGVCAPDTARPDEDGGEDQMSDDEDAMASAFGCHGLQDAGEAEPALALLLLGLLRRRRRQASSRRQ
ncbi:MAG: hypothetical protein ACO3JL_20210, partial [Myxococcota bacterium]